MFKPLKKKKRNKTPPVHPFIAGEKISLFNSIFEQRLIPARLRLHQCERSSHLCKQSVKEKRLADCKYIICHAAFIPVKSLAVIGWRSLSNASSHTGDTQCVTTITRDEKSAVTDGAVFSLRKQIFFKCTYWRKALKAATGDLGRSSGGPSVASANANAKRCISSTGWQCILSFVVRRLSNIQQVSDRSI